MPDTESVPCPLCGSAETRRLWQGDGFAMGRCRVCGLVRQDPRRTQEWLLHHHYGVSGKREGPLVARPQAYEGLAEWQPEPTGAFEAGVLAVESCRPSEGPKGVWLDVGASAGAMLVAARAAGWKVAGVEPNPRQVEVCRDVHGIDVEQGVLETARFPDGFAEVVSYRHVLEHVHDLGRELAEARRVLAPGGLLLVEVPHWGGSRYRTGAVRTALGLGRSFWSGLNVPQHLYYFTASTLSRLLQHAGLTPLSKRTYGRTRQRPRPLRRLYDASRDRLGLGNKLRLVARRAP